MVDALRARSITQPFPVQEMVIRDGFACRDLLVQSPTGSGKTLAFGVPLVDLIDPGGKGPRALVLAPTRELASQIVAARRADILVATPCRLEDLIVRGAISLSGIRVLVLDEADRMLDMGFRPAVDRIVAQTPADRQTMFFSATMEGAADKVAAAYTCEARFHTHAEPEREEAKVEHRFLPVDSQGDKSQSQRERALARFGHGEVMTLVATDVAARGIDIADVAHVVNYDAPEDRETYVHRVGCTGRAGRTGTGFVLTDQAEEMRRITANLWLEDGLGKLERQAIQPAHRTTSGTPRRAIAIAAAAARPQPEEMAANAVRWSCARCEVSVGRIDGEPTLLPASWLRSGGRTFCLACSRARAGEAAIDSAPTASSREELVRLRRTALIEFEIDRAPEVPNRTIAQACRTSGPVVAAVRAKLDRPTAVAPDLDAHGVA